VCTFCNALATVSATRMLPLIPIVVQQLVRCPSFVCAGRKW
jgi:hypothetical protein